MLKVKNNILPTIAFYEADKVDVTQLELFETFKEKRMFLILLEFEHLKTVLHKLEKFYRESKPLIKFDTGGAWALAKPEIIVPVIESDHHAVRILSIYGGLLMASLSEKKARRTLKEIFRYDGLRIKKPHGWLIVSSSYKAFINKAA